MNDLQMSIENSIEQLDPAIELIALEQPSAETLRLFIDHPGGVTLELCERVTKQLRELLAEYSLEVSSPGLDRPLTKPAHFERFVGRNVQVRTNEPVAGSRNFTGRLTAAGEAAISVETERGKTEIPLDTVRRSNLVPELSEVTS